MPNWNDENFVKIPQKKNSPDDFQTPDYALNYLAPYLKKEWVIWECAAGKGNLTNGLKNRGFDVVATDILYDFNFLTQKAEVFDCIVTNPPYSLKQEFIERCYQLSNHFALLMPLTALESEKRQKWYREKGIQLIIPNKRINFETPSGLGKSAWFPTAWFCYGLDLPKDIVFVTKD